MNSYRENKFHTWIIKMMLILPVCVLVVVAIYGLMMSRLFPAVVAMILVPILFFILWMYAGDESTPFKVFLKRALSILFIFFIAAVTCFCLFSVLIPDKSKTATVDQVENPQFTENEDFIRVDDEAQNTHFNYSDQELFNAVLDSSDISEILHYLEGRDGQRYWSDEDVHAVFAYAYQKGYLDAKANVHGGMTEEYVDGYEFTLGEKQFYDSLFF